MIPCTHHADRGRRIKPPIFTDPTSRITCAWALTSLGPSNRRRHDSRGLKEACGGSERAQRLRGWWGRSRAGRANSSVIKFRFSAHLLFAHGALSPAAWPAGGSSRPARAPEFSWRRLASAWLRSKTRRTRVVSAGNVVRVVSGGPPAGERAPCQTVSLSTFGMAGRSITDEIANTVASSIPFMAGSLTLVMLGLLVLLGGGSTCRESRVPLGLGAILTIELSIGAGFGLPAACGIPLTDFSMFIFFAAIGIGVDDVIVIVDGFDRTPKDMPVPDRVEAAMREGGVAIFLTSFTNFIAFLVASTIDFPCVRWFCLFSGSVLFFEFVFTITLFTSLLVLDERRQTRGSNQNITTSAPSPFSTAGVKGDLAADDGAPQSEMVGTTNDQKNVVVGVDVLPHDADTPGAANTTGYPRVLAVLQRTAVPVVTRPAGALIVVLVAAFAAGLSGAGASGIEMGIPLENNFLDTSYLTSLFDLLDHYWGSLPGRGYIAKSLDYGTQQDVAATRALTSGFELDSLVLPPVESWLDSFSAWRDCTVTDFAYSSSTEEPLFTATAPGYDESASFEANLDQFLVLDLLQCNRSSTPPSSPSASATDLVRSSSGSVTVARYPIMVFISTTVPGRISAAHQLRARWDTESDSVDGFVFSDFLLYADRDSLMWPMVASTLSFAAIAVLAVLALFIHPVHVALTGLCLCVVNLLMLGLMRVWDIPIDTLSFIPLAMASDMSVDYGTLSRARWERVECMF